MRLEIDIAEHHYNNIMALDSVSLGRVPYKGIIMYSINAIKHGKVLEQEPTIENDKVDCERTDCKNCVNHKYCDYEPNCQRTDEGIAKSFIEDVEAVKDQLPCGQMMDFPNTFDEFAEDYGFRDKKEIYTNGSELIPVFRVKQWLEHISTTKNDLGVDCISRKAVLDAIDSKAWEFCDYLISKGRNDEQKPVSHFADNLRECVREELPSVTPQEPRWIPVSERLPDMDDEVLCWYEYYHWSHGKVLPEYGLGRYLRETSAWFGEVANGKDVRVIAWMPLPKGYKEVEE